MFRLTDRSEDNIKVMQEYLAASGMLRDYLNVNQDPVFSETVTLDLATVVSSVSGPKRPHDRVSVSDMKKDFGSCLTNPVGFFLLPVGFQIIVLVYCRLGLKDSAYLRIS